MTLTKIIKRDGEQPTEFEEKINNELMTLQANSDLKIILRELFLNSAKEYDISAARKVMVLSVPVPQWNSYQKIHQRLVRELEKKFSTHHVIIVSNRRIIKKPSKKSKNNPKQKRPRSRTLTAVHEALLKDMIFPGEIVGQRLRMRADGSRLLRVFIDTSSKNTVEHKIDAFEKLYKQLTGKDVKMEFPAYTL